MIGFPLGQCGSDGLFGCGDEEVLQKVIRMTKMKVMDSMLDQIASVLSAAL